MMRTRPYTNIELFREVCKLVELPKILDYYLPASDVCEIKSCEYTMAKVKVFTLISDWNLLTTKLSGLEPSKH